MSQSKLSPGARIDQLLRSFGTGAKRMRWLRRLAVLHSIDQRLARLEEAVQGGRSTYMGNGLILVKTVVEGAQFGFLVEAEDRLISPWFIVSGRYETELTDFFTATLRPGDRCLDIGANFGYFTCLFARFCPEGQVIGVEPDAKLFGILRDNIHINGFGGHAAARHAAACEAEREVTLFRRLGRSANTSIVSMPESFTDHLGEPPNQPFTVAGTTVDRLAEAWGGRVDVMKVDVEGAEPLVLAGAAATIAANPDLQIVMEWSPGQIRAAGVDLGEFLDQVAGMGLLCHGLGPGRPLLSRDTLLGLHYAAGILLARRPR
ncbi:FkbM family methyltransferase [Belnapia sp. T6]|uniref:FkbM family methyltransferase n=1 Tax=Belnapia mucosa TaxID=2804532 RepID=A0ABS1UXH0_9PROT|nr:FkbM family methyltransferase [Belnapia mucosa]MBL6454169.1 FkbM family methyltransferase [Belnapia mucosa]